MFEFTLANSVTVNARAQFDDGKITTNETVTTVTSLLSNVAQFTNAQSQSKTASSSHIKDKTTTIKVAATKDPLETEHQKQFSSKIKEYDSILRTISNTIPATTSSYQAIKFDEIPSNTTGSKNVHNVLVHKFEAKSSTLANKNTKTISKNTIFNTTPTLKSSKTIKASTEKTVTFVQEFKQDPQNRSNSLMGKSNVNQIIDKGDYVKSDINLLPQSDATLSSSTGSMKPSSDETEPTRDIVYFVVAVIGGAKIWARTLSQTLIDMGQPFNDTSGSPLRPIYIDLPTNGRYVLSFKFLRTTFKKRYKSIMLLYHY